jgi:hypothetical protein
LRWGFTLAATAALPGWPATIELAGVKLEDTTELRNNRLVLNGAGIRYKAVFKVYVAALYLGRKTTVAEEALQMPGMKRIAITMLRDIDANELGKLLTRGVEDNLPRSDFVKIIPDLARLGQLFAEQKKLLAGDIFLIDWLPDAGTLITVKGIPQGLPFKQPEFFSALLRIWLGQVPADDRLKEALLGKPIDTASPGR